MGRMKEVFLKMKEENYKGDPQEYLKEYAENLKSIKEIDILCPNCFKGKLLQENETDCSCPGCGQGFTMTNNTLRYK